eukprot:CAMPEP_0170853314 /NCGR_PEP_ID=MMETSP0734-20130129/12436_1 /TAXON_ID=186038 /ORGANISM="Fragilariopsis kerguelensis, Strain L26-C5" /LENGTH=72 /DNA_ID=CAMNT_0011223963 /DNA_START=1345 /DNA_END=1563 /DNA_ORIENTATION=+
MPFFPHPGPGWWTIRIIATNDMEFPFEAVVTPYEQFQDAQKVDSMRPDRNRMFREWGLAWECDRTTAGVQRW